MMREPYTEIPSWMLEETSYDPPEDKDGFIRKTILQLMSILRMVRSQTVHSPIEANASIRLLYVLLAIILLSCSHNMIYSFCLMAVWLMEISLLKGETIFRILSGSLTAALLSMILLLPAVFLGSYNTALTIALKVFVSVGLLQSYAATTPWNQITESLRFFHVPDLFISVCDITIKYIVILGEVCYDMLIALRIRSIGCNKEKGRSLGGVLGVTFLKSRQMAEDMYDAMICRGYEGEYHKRHRYLFRKGDLLYLGLMLLAVILFFCLR